MVINGYKIIKEDKRISVNELKGALTGFNRQGLNFKVRLLIHEQIFSIAFIRFYQTFYAAGGFCWI